MQILSKLVGSSESYGYLKISNNAVMDTAIVVSLWRHLLLIKYA